VKRNWRLRLLIVAGILVALAAWGTFYVTHPLVFNELFWSHAHCMPQATFELISYADKHGGKFPTHAAGYGDALLLLDPDCDYALTGPGYDETPIVELGEPDNICQRKNAAAFTFKD
jgi:hypothetical protein